MQTIGFFNFGPFWEARLLPCRRDEGQCLGNAVMGSILVEVWAFVKKKPALVGERGGVGLERYEGRNVKPGIISGKLPDNFLAKGNDL